jgi:hypothetical protein
MFLKDSYYDVNIKKHYGTAVDKAASDASPMAKKAKSILPKRAKRAR